MRALPIVKIKNLPQNWILENQDRTFLWLLEACEYHLEENNSNVIKMMVIENENGSTTFQINGYHNLLKSLGKAMDYFAEVENYELATRARDCLNKWKESKKT